jgi:uncharacterized membrane-anchored protein YhcB (DUF1043 family)
LRFRLRVPRTTRQHARIKTIQTNLNNAKAAFDQLPDDVKKATARSQRRLAHMADAVDRLAPNLAKGPRDGWQEPSGGFDVSEDVGTRMAVSA